MNTLSPQNPTRFLLHINSRKTLGSLSPPSIAFSKPRVSLSPTSICDFNWKPQAAQRKSKKNRRKENEAEEEERHVHCAVDVVSWREGGSKLGYWSTPTWTLSGMFSRITRGSPISSPILFTVEELTVRSRGGYGWSRGGCSGLCIGTLRRGLFWIFRSFRIWQMGASFSSRWLMGILRSLKENGLLKPVQGLQRQFYLMKAEKNSEESQKMSVAGVASASAVQSIETEENHAASGLTTIPVSPNTESSSKWGVFGQVCRLDRPCMVDEVHLRRFDGLLENGGTHRCVVASITVKAPVQEVWSVLTAYEQLPEIVPNLVISKILLRDNNKVRILQEGCKGLLYMVLHARVVLDLHEKFEEEIRFEQTEGDFDSFQGKWLLEQLGNHHTLLKYTVESKMHTDTFLSEAIVEEVIYEDLPSNLCAIRDFVEKREAAMNDSLSTPNAPDDHPIPVEDNHADDSEIKLAEEASSSAPLNPLKQRPKVPGLQRDIDVLKAEIVAFISQHGQEGFMPMRKQLRLHGRVDIEKAITRMGGFRKIASLMNLSLAYKHRKPKGYWDNLENLQEEISRFQRNWGMDPAYMPSRKSFERAGRYDIARALEKWGGLQEVSRLLSLELRHSRRKLEIDKQIDVKVFDDSNGQEKTSNKTHVSQDTQKWLMKLKDLDINWVE